MKGHAGVDTAEIELKPLADSVRPTTKDHHLWFVRHLGFVGAGIGAIQVRCMSLKFGGTCIDTVIDWDDS
jgi:hypothetical protein